MEKIVFEGILVINHFVHSHTKKHEFISLLDKDGVVKAISNLFHDSIQSIVSIEKRLLYYKRNNTFLDIMVDGISTKFDVIENFGYSVEGWGHSDDDAQESGNGIDITDSLHHIRNKKISDYLYSCINKNVRLELICKQ